MPSYAEVEAVVMGLTRCDCRCSPTEDVPSDHSTIAPYGCMTIWPPLQSHTSKFCIVLFVACYSNLVNGIVGIVHQIVPYSWFSKSRGSGRGVL